MQAFITGASGFIGSRLTGYLRESGWAVRVLVHRTAVQEERGIETVRGDIRNPEAWKDALRGTDVLFHLAAALGFSLIPREEFLRINAGGTESLLHAAREAGVKKVIHVSSAGVIGAVKAGQVATEDFPPNPRNVYDLTKLEAERTALRFAHEGMNVVIVRPGWAFGPADRRTFKLIKAIQYGRFALIAPDRGRQTPVFIDDLVEGLRLTAEKGRAGEIYHLTGNEILTVREMAVKIAEACSVRLVRLSLPLFAAKTAAWTLEKTFALLKKEAPLNRSKLSFFIHPKALSNEKARRELGFRPAIDFQAGLRKTIAWYQEHGWL